MVAFPSTVSSRRSTPVTPVKAYLTLSRYIRDTMSLQQEREELDEALDSLYHYISEGSTPIDRKTTDDSASATGN